MPSALTAQIASFTNVDLSVNPRIPGPNQQVTVTLSSFSFNVDRSSISWFVNGSLVEQGVGVKSTTFTTGNVGERSTVSVSIRTDQGIQLNESVVIIPASVALVWEALTDTPALYKGRALHSPESRVRLYALPNIIVNGSNVSSRNIIYTWSRDGTVLGSFSGTGRDTITLTNPGFLRDLVVTVTATAPGQAAVAQNTVVIDVVDPEVHFYENSPLLGIRTEKSLTDFSIIEDEATVSASPYYFSPAALEFNWRIDGERVATGDQDITLRPEGGEGSANVDVEVLHPVAILQTVQKSLNVTFGAQGASPFVF